MRLRLPVVAAILLAGCAIQQPPVSQQPPGLSDTPKSQINKDRDRDLSECERESAFAGAGDKRQVFDRCMKARGY
jgi:outer membrane biogenesis lipoprotein LolB